MSRMFYFKIASFTHITNTRNFITRFSLRGHLKSYIPLQISNITPSGEIYSLTMMPLLSWWGLSRNFRDCMTRMETMYKRKETGNKELVGHLCGFVQVFRCSELLLAGWWCGWAMAFKSNFYVPIPENTSWPHYVFQNFDEYGDSKAVVSYQICIRCLFSRSHIT